MPEDTCGCGEPIVCLICDACPEHCLPEGRPDLRWEARAQAPIRRHPNRSAEAEATGACVSTLSHAHHERTRDRLQRKHGSLGGSTNGVALEGPWGRLRNMRLWGLLVCGLAGIGCADPAPCSAIETCASSQAEADRLNGNNACKPYVYCRGLGDGGALDAGDADVQSADVMLDSTNEATDELDAGASDAVDEISDACTQGAVFNAPCGPQGVCCPGLVCNSAGDRPVCIYTP